MDVEHGEENLPPEWTKAREELLEGSDLRQKSALDALETLQINWRDAIADGADPQRLLADVDEVCRLLQEYKKAALPKPPNDLQF